MLSRLIIGALWSPAGKGLTSWLLFVIINCVLSLFHVVSCKGSVSTLFTPLVWCGLYSLVWGIVQPSLREPQVLLGRRPHAFVVIF